MSLGRIDANVRLPRAVGSSAVSRAEHLRNSRAHLFDSLRRRRVNFGTIVKWW